jgi:hypothetical protein
VGRMYGPMSKLKNKPLTKLSGPHFKEKLSETTKKQVFMLFAICYMPFGRKKVPKGRHVGGTYGPICKLKNQPITKLLGPFLTLSGPGYFEV